MNKELRIRLSPDNKQSLKDRKKELFTATGNKITWSAAINSLIASYRDLFIEHEETLCRIHAALAPQTRRTHAANAPQTQNPHARETVDLNIKEKKYTKKEPQTAKRGKHLLPKDFSPPRSIASEAGIDYEGAMACFADWANSAGTMKTDWVATFRNACKSWIKKDFPDLRRIPIHPHGNTEILRNEDMNDTRPSLV
jgi:hypothetical protein